MIFIKLDIPKFDTFRRGCSPQQAQKKQTQRRWIFTTYSAQPKTRHPWFRYHRLCESGRGSPRLPDQFEPAQFLNRPTVITSENVLPIPCYELIIIPGIASVSRRQTVSAFNKATPTNTWSGKRLRQEMRPDKSSVFSGQLADSRWPSHGTSQYLTLNVGLSSGRVLRLS
jgi:hypothetical protein